MDNAPLPPDPLLERFIGALTMALGLGVILRASSLASYLTNGQRPAWSLAMLAVGGWLIIASYFGMPRLRICVLLLAGIIWFGLLHQFLNAQLYGGAMQAAVTIIFSLICARRIAKWRWKG